MGEIDVYNTIRQEIITNHSLMHWYSIVVALVLLIGVWIVEKRETILSVFLPLLSLAWAAAMVRFDFFIQRQGAYLRVIESRLLESGISIPMWETWKSSLISSRFIVPFADIIALIIIAAPTLYLLFGPAQQYFVAREWRGAKLYAWSVSILILLLLSLLAVIPAMASWGTSYGKPAL